MQNLSIPKLGFRLLLMLVLSPFFAATAFTQDMPTDTLQATDTVKEIVLDEQQLTEYTGTFQVTPEKRVTFSVEDGWLVGKPEGDTKEKLYPQGEDTFLVKRVGATIQFNREEGVITSLTFTQKDQKMKAIKI